MNSLVVSKNELVISPSANFFSASTPNHKALTPKVDRVAEFFAHDTESQSGFGHGCSDNNLVANIIRPVALGRKNYLFLGNHE
jgi:hypothetical protein